jgi:septal ring factor EnvC (AmiA/AmiB activator)
MRLASVAAIVLAAAPDPAARARLDALTAREAALTARMDANRTTLVRLLSALESLRRDPPPALLVRPERARDAARAAMLLKAVTPELQARARRFAAQAEELRRVRRQAAEAGAELFAAESARAEAAPPPPPPPPRQGDLAAPSATPAPVVAAGPAPTHLAPPVQGRPVRRFGEVQPGRPRSEGWSWQVAAGAPVVAPTAGEVEFSGPLRGQDLVAVVRVGGGWRVVLSGLGRIATPAGSIVRAGERLGEAAAGGEVALQLRRGADPVDPGPLLTTR